MCIRDRFRNQWGYRPERGEADVDFKERIRAELRGRLDEAKAEGLLVPQVIWGYFPVNAEGNDLIVYADDPASGGLSRPVVAKARGGRATKRARQAVSP